MQIQWCKLCVETNTRPTTQFEDGICVACRNTSKLASEKIDWKARRKVLDEIVTWAKSKNVSGYDCIIGVSGGKDSTRQALFAREIGLKPLLVSCVYSPEQQTERGAQNLANLVSLGFDTLTVAPAPEVSKELMHYCLKKYGNIANAMELVLYASLPKTAIAYNIPLILLGENPGLAWGTDSGSQDHDANRMKQMNTLKGGHPRQFSPDHITDQQLYWYFFPEDSEIERAKIKIVYIGYFLPDFNDHTNSDIAVKHGLTIRTGKDADPENMGGIYPHVALDLDYVFPNQMIKYLKFGFGKASQEVGQAIRFGLMTREEGIELVKKYDGKCGDFYLREMCRYLGISDKEFWDIIDPFVNKELFSKDENGKWKFKYEIH